MGMLKCEEIRKGLTAYDVAARLLGTVRLPLNVETILEAMRIGDRVMSEKAVQFWIENFSSLLYSKSELYPHEFLLLLAQGRQRSTMLRTAFNTMFNEKFALKESRNGLPKPFKVRIVGDYINTQVKEAVDDTTGNLFKVHLLPIT